MKTRIYFIVFTIVFSLVPFAKAETNKEYTDRMFDERFEPFRESMNRNIDTINGNVDIYNKRLGDIERSLTELKSTVKDLQSAVESLSKRVSEIDGKPPIVSGPLLPTWALFIIVIVCVIIVMFVIFIFWPQKKVSPPASMGLFSRPKCPRCGWEHAPGDTICKNPSCKTQF